MRALVNRGDGTAAVDLRGHGGSSTPDDGYDFATVAADLVAVAGALGMDRPVVAGQSWGGNVVLELARRHPHHVTQVVCVDGGVIELSRQFEQVEDPPVARLQQRLAVARRFGHYVTFDTQSDPASETFPSTEKQKAQQDKMRACSKEAKEKGMKGDQRKTFMSDCMKKA